jgi:hypothetical protein
MPVISNCIMPTPQVYGGTVDAFQTLLLPWMCPSGGLSALAVYPYYLPLFIINVPLSFAADTLILPYTIYNQVKYGNIEYGCNSYPAGARRHYELSRFRECEQLVETEVETVFEGEIVQLKEVKIPPKPIPSIDEYGRFIVPAGSASSYMSRMPTEIEAEEIRAAREVVETFFNHLINNDDYSPYLGAELSFKFSEVSGFNSVFLDNYELSRFSVHGVDIGEKEILIYLGLTATSEKVVCLFPSAVTLDRGRDKWEVKRVAVFNTIKECRNESGTYQFVQ